jgi:serine/threonine protein kinase
MDELTERVQAGEVIDVEALLRDHPDQADQIRELLPALHLLADMAVPASSRAESDAAGDRPEELGDFRIVREIGRGGMGIVYEAEQRSLGRRVALKVLPFAATMDPRQLQRFRHEAQAAALLHHPNIVPVYFVGCERGVHFYAMQLIEGASLADALAAQRDAHHVAAPHTPEATAAYHPAPEAHAAQGAHRAHDAHRAHEAPTAPVAALSTEPGRRGRDYYRRAAELAAQAADALEYAHAMGVVHRDVKPANLLLDARGHLWVTDFGLARFGPDAGLTVSGDLLGTLRYMSPEQALARHGLVDHRTDVYSLGATLYELLTLRPAVGGADKQETLRRIAFEEPTAPRKLDRSIPVELETVTLKCLAKNPAERYATAAELADDLRRWLADQTIKAKPPSLRQRAAKWARRHQPVVWAAAAVGLVGVAAVAALAGLAWHKNGQLSAAYARAERGWRLNRRALDDMSSKVIDDLLARQPALSEDQKDFLKRALAYYQELAAEAGDDEETRAAVAEAYLRVGHISKRLGLTVEAERGYARSRELSERLAADYPHNPAYQHSLAESLEYLGHLLSVSSRQAEAERCLRQALAISRKLAADFPAVPDYQSGLAHVYYGLGNVLRITRRLAEAEYVERQALTLREKLADDFPGVPLYRDRLAESYQWLGNVLRDRGRLLEAEKALRRTVELREKLHTEDRGSPRYRGALADPLNDLGHILSRLGRKPEAEECYRRSIALCEKLVDDFPADINSRRFLALGYHGLGDVLHKDGRREEAESYYRLARPLWERLASEAPTVPQHHAALGDILKRLGLPAEAEAAFRNVIKLLPDAAEFQDELGMVLIQQGKSVEAVAVYRKALELQPLFPDEAADMPRYNAACAAALAGCGRGKDAGNLSDEERTHLRRQSLTWLRAELQAWGQRLDKDANKARRVVAKKMQHWQGDSDFAGVRGPEALSHLPAAERQEWQTLWDDVAALLQRADAPRAPSDPRPDR